MMQRDRQLDDPETSPEVPAGDRNGTDRLGAQLVRQLPQSGLWQAAQVLGSIEGIQKWGLLTSSVYFPTWSRRGTALITGHCG